MNDIRCEMCEEKGFITTSQIFDTEEGGKVVLRWCSNVQCDYNERLETSSREYKKFTEENIL